MSRMTKEELRHDAFAEGTVTVSNYVQKHFMTVLVAVLALAVIVVGGMYFRQSSLRTNEQAAQLMHRSMAQYTSGAYGEALVSTEDLLTRFSGSAERNPALYLSGASHLALGENEDAVNRFNEYLAADANGLYANSAVMGLGLALEARGDNADAAQRFRDLRGKLPAADPLFVQATFAQARALQAVGQMDAAVTVLKELLGSTDFAARQQAESKIAVLEAMGKAS